MVCLGNICRSPLAQGILESKIDPDRVWVDSAGTGAYHVGELPDPRSIEIARKHNIDITNQSARQFIRKDFVEFDHIFVMDKENLRNVLMLAKNEVQKQKVSLILSQNTNSIEQEVPDPYYGGAQGFQYVYELLDEACNLIAQRIRENE